MSESDIDHKSSYRLYLTGDQLETLREVMRLSIENDTEQAGRESHADDRASYHKALSDQHAIMAAIETAEEDGE